MQMEVCACLIIVAGIQLCVSEVVLEEFSVQLAVCHDGVQVSAGLHMDNSLSIEAGETFLHKSIVRRRRQGLNDLGPRLHSSTGIQELFLISVLCKAMKHI